MCRECNSRLLFIDKSKKRIIIETYPYQITLNWNNSLILHVYISDENKLSLFHRDLLTYHVDKARTNSLLFLVFAENWFNNRGCLTFMDYHSSLVNPFKRIMTSLLLDKTRKHFNLYGSKNFNLIL